MIGALLLLASGVVGGTLATWRFAPRLSGAARLAWGTVIGWTLLAFGGYAAALLLGMGPATLLAAAVVALLPATSLLRPRFRARLRDEVRAARAGWARTLTRLANGPARAGRPGITAGDIVSALWIGGVTCTLVAVAAATLFETAGGGLAIRNVNNLGDLPYHASITTAFAWGDNYPPLNPVFAGSGLSYHYISDFLTALPLAAGASLPQAWFLVTVGLLLALAGVLQRWGREVAGSAGAARLVTLIVLASGGMGWVMLLDGGGATGQSMVDRYLAGDARYTIGDPDGLYRFGNAITTLLIPQRGLLLGFGLAVIVLTLLWRQVDTRMDLPTPSGAGRPGLPGLPAGLAAIPGWQRMLAAGLMTGVLPLVHIHSWAVILGTAFLLGVVFLQWREGRWRAWAVYVVAAVALSVPTLYWETNGSQASFTSFLGFQWWWDAGDHNPLVFWAANAGLFIVLLGLGYLAHLSGSGRLLLGGRLARYSAVFVAWFVLANVMRLAPWIWDNIKVLLFWWLGAAPVVALLLVRLWRDGGAARRALAGVLLAAITLSGLLDIGRAIIGPREYGLWDGDGVAFAAEVRDRVPAGAVILADPTFTSPVLLSGRPMFIGYTGWLFANGLPYGPREQDVRTMYAGTAGAEDLLRARGIEFIVLGPQERADLHPDEAFLGRFPLVVEVGAYRLLRVNP